MNNLLLFGRTTVSGMKAYRELEAMCERMGYGLEGRMIGGKIECKLIILAEDD